MADKPPERFNEVSPEVREFLAGLRKDEIEIISKAVRFYAAATLFWRFMAWVIGGLVAAIVGVWGVVEVIGKMIGTIKGAK